MWSLKSSFNPSRSRLISILPIFFALIGIGKSVSTDIAPGNIQSNSTCSNKCSVDTMSGLACFTDSLLFYDQMMVSSLNDWLNVQDNLVQWNFRHTSGYKGMDKAAEKTETFKRWTALLPPRSNVDGAIITACSDKLIDKIINVRVTAPPLYMCPVRCDYTEQLWLYMFIASALLNVALFLSVIPFMISSMRRDKMAGYTN